MNKIYKNKNNKKPMTIQNLKIYVIDTDGVDWFTADRIEGSLCKCDGNGEFVLESRKSIAVKEGGKHYMQCKICNEYSHL